MATNFGTFEWPPSGAGAGANASVGVNGAPAPTSSTEIAGVTPGGNLQPVSVDTSGNVNINVVSSSVPTGGATSANQVIEITALQAIQSNTNGVATAANQVTMEGTLTTIATNTTGASTAALQTSGNASLTTIATNTTNLTVAQGSTTSGQSGQLVQGAVTTASPTYSNGQTDPLSLTTAGALRTDASATTQPISYFDLTTSGTITTQNLNVSSGTPTPGSTVGLTLNGQGAVAFNVMGTYTGALTVQLSMDGVNWTQAPNVFKMATQTVVASVVSAAQDSYWIGTSGFAAFRLSANAAVTGTATITMRASQANIVSYSAGAAQIVTQGSNAAIANSWYTKLSDGTTGPVAVKAASTAAAVGDIAMVVAISPNNIIPVKAAAGTLTDGSGSTSATPSTSTQIFTSNVNRKYLLIQNLSLTVTIYVNFTSSATATTGSYALAPLGTLVQEANFVSNEAVNVLAASASIPFTAKQG